MGEMKPTPGPWYAKNHVVYTDAMPKRIWGRDNEFSGPYIVMQTGLYSSPDDATTYANARLVAEAGTVFHNTGLSPVQLVEQRDELLAACKKLVEWEAREKDHAIGFMERINLCEAAFQMMYAALAKCEGVK